MMIEKLQKRYDDLPRDREGRNVVMVNVGVSGLTVDVCG